MNNESSDLNNNSMELTARPAPTMPWIRYCHCGSKIAKNMPSTINLCKNCGYNNYFVIMPDKSARMVSKAKMPEKYKPKSGDTVVMTLENLMELAGRN